MAAVAVAAKPSVQNFPNSPPHLMPSAKTSASVVTKQSLVPRPNTTMTGLPGGQILVTQKLSFTKLPSIVSRMRQETLSSRSKKKRFYRSDTYVDYKFYTWKNLALWSDYQSHLWTPNGSVKTSFRK